MRIAFKILNEVAKLYTTVLQFADVYYETQRNALFIRIKEAASLQTVRAIAHEQPRGAMIALELKALADGFCRQFDYLLNARGHLPRRKHFGPTGLLGKYGINCIGRNHDIGQHGVVAGPYSGTLPVFHQKLVHTRIPEASKAPASSALDASHASKSPLKSVNE
jgi:hypothetical protein